MKNKRKNWINITLSILLVLALLSSGFGGYTLAKNLRESPAERIHTPGEGDPQKPDDEKNEVVPNTNIPGGEGLKNEMTLKEDVKVFAEDAAKTINASITDVEVVSSSFASGDRLEIKLSKSQEELFGGLRAGDIFVLEGDKNSPLGETYILKADYIYGWKDSTVLRTSQPYFDEVFENIALNINETVSEENLRKAMAAPGVEMHFGAIEEEFENAASMGSIRAVNAGENPKIQNLATEIQTEPRDFIITLDYDLKKSDPKKDKETGSSGILDLDAGADFKLKGKIGIKDLSAYMVCDMPEPLQFNELFLGVRGEKFVDVGLNAELSASFSGQATEASADFLIGNVKASGLNEKLIPLGIWMFAGTTPITVNSATYKSLRISPSIFLMLYADWEGNISLKFTASFAYKEQFNGGLRVVKDGKLSMNMENYPYNVGNEGNADEDGAVWSVDLDLAAETDLTLLGGSVLFCIGGINIGEISLMRIGLEAECDLAIKASTDTGIETPNAQDSTYYLRGYVKVGEVKVRLKADINIFWHDWGFEFNFEFCLLNLTLFQVGNMPDQYKPVNPVSSKPYPDSFDSVITLVCDVSGSMDDRVGTGETKLSAAIQAGLVITGMVESFSKQYSGAYGIGVVQFSNDAKTLAFPHTDYPFIEDCIQSMKVGGGTNIASGLESAVEQLGNVKANSKVIILMTDGQDNMSGQSAILKQAADAKAKSIRIFTVGFGADADEEILTQVAAETGGEYRFADTNNIVGIIGSFMYAQQASDAKVLSDQQGTVSQGETTEAKTFKVPDEAGNLNGILYWPGSVLDLILIDPNGRAVDADYPGATITEANIPATVTITDPLPGRWKLQVKGVETSYEEEPYYVITSFKKAETDIHAAPELDTLTLIGAYCLPGGAFLLILCTMLLIFVNVGPAKKRKRDVVS